MANTPEERISVELTASVAGLLAGLDAGTAAVKTATSTMTVALDGMKAAVGALTGPLVALMAVLKGGEMFKDAIHETVAWNDTAVQLARTLGVTTEEASVLAVALDDIFVSTETYTKAAQMMTRQIATGGEGFKKLGVEVKDGNGQFRSTVDLMTDVLTKLNGLKQGTDRNVAGLSIFGRSWGEAQKLLKLSADSMREAKEKAESLNLIVGGDSFEATRRYKNAIQDLDDVFLAVKVAIANAVLPVLTQLAKWFAETGPAALTVFKFLWDSFVFALDTALVPFRVLADILVAFGHALTGDFGAAKEALKEIPGDIDVIGRAIDRALAGVRKPTKTTVGAQGDGDANTTTKDESEKELAKWKAELEEKKALEENWFTWSNAEEVEYWSRKFALTTKGTKAYLAVLTELNRLGKDTRKEEHEKDVDYAKYEMELAAENLKLKLKWAQAIVDGERAIYGAGSKQEIAALRDLEKVKKEIRDKEKKDAFEAFQPLTDAWHGALAGMLANTQSFTQAVGNLWIGLGQVLDRAILHLADEWIGTEAKKLALYIAGKARELVVHTTTEAAKTTSTVANAGAQITANAAVAGSAAAVSAAETPGIGWLIAIPAALAVVAGVMALKGGIASAAGGWGTVPSDQVAQLHKNEMVLPASIAEPLRQSLAGGGVGGGDTFHIHAVDAKSFADMLDRNEGALIARIATAARNGRFNPGR